MVDRTAPPQYWSYSVVLSYTDYKKEQGKKSSKNNVRHILGVDELFEEETVAACA